MENLISMTDFVLEQRKIFKTDNIRRFWACENYAKFLKQPLELWMFVPCDSEDNVLEEPISHQLETYEKAKERCLFHGYFSIYRAKQ
jgi:hypothetical protein